MLNVKTNFNAFLLTGACSHRPQSKTGKISWSKFGTSEGKNLEFGNYFSLYGKNLLFVPQTLNLTVNDNKHEFTELNLNTNYI